MPASGPLSRTVGTLCSYRNNSLLIEYMPVRGVQYAKCTSEKKTVAMEEAAKYTLQQLQGGRH